MKLLKAALVSFSLLASSLAVAESTKPVLEKLVEQADIHNGDARVSTYDPQNFKLTTAIRSLNSALPNDPDSTCRYSTSGHRKTSLQRLKSRDIEDGVYEALVELNERGLIKYMISRNHADGEREHCWHDYFEVYTTDGYVLGIYYDYTT